MAEKQLETMLLSMGNGPHGHFEYEIHKVIFDGIEQYRLRLWDYKDKLKVRFAKTWEELDQCVPTLLQESLK